MSRSSLDWDNSYDALEHRYKTDELFPFVFKDKKLYKMLLLSLPVPCVIHFNEI